MAVRFAWLSGAFALVFAVFLLACASFTAGSIGAWPRETLILSLCAVLTVPAWLSGLVFLTSFMEKALYGAAGRSRLKVTLGVAGSWLFMLLWFAAWSWPICSALWVYPIWDAIVMAGFLIVLWHAWALAQSSHLRRQYQEEWACLPIDTPS